MRYSLRVKAVTEHLAISNVPGNFELFTSIHEIKLFLNSSDRYDSTRLTCSTDSNCMSSVDVRPS